MVKRAVIKTIRLYQKTISFDHGWLRHRFPAGFCRFNPTCSEYAVQAVDKYGALRGLGMGFWRVMRCHPWSRGGSDPVR